jgi:hypothetical protein
VRYKEGEIVVLIDMVENIPVGTLFEISQINTPLYELYNARYKGIWVKGALIQKATKSEKQKYRVGVINLIF